MINKHITLSLILLLFIPFAGIGQENSSKVASSKSLDPMQNLRWFTGSIQIPERFTVKQINFNHKVYWLMGVDSPGFQTGMPSTTVYTYVDKPKLSILSEDELTTPQYRDVTIVKTSYTSINYRDNLAPSIQITF